MLTLREKLQQSDEFLIGTELVSVRGGMGESSAIKARHFANDLIASPAITWISITDNAGGNPQLAPTALGKPILYAGKEVVIHLTCKDLNRNGLESEAWLLHSEGFQNILAMTGDFPVAGAGGAAKPVFDIDSVGLIALLSQMNAGLPGSTAGARVMRPAAQKTNFLVGAVTTNFKRHAGEVEPQYAKLVAKIRCGAEFIINQIGFDARKQHELRLMMQAQGVGGTPVIGNVYLLNARVAELFHAARIPGVVVTTALRDLCLRQAASPDKGRGFFEEFAAKQIAIYRGLGYRGAYLGGVHAYEAVDRILAIERRFAADDWRQFARELQYAQAGEYFSFGQDAATGLADPARPTPRRTGPRPAGRIAYQFSKWVHDAMFTPETVGSRVGARLCANSADPMQGPKPLRVIEHLSKAALFRCQDCGDCSLPEIAFLCPESQCAKNQRNGPCGGTRDGRCEVDGYGDCIWLRAYERLQPGTGTAELLAHAPVVQNQALRGTSSWANTWLGRDHLSRPHPAARPPDPSTSSESPNP